MTLRQHGLKLGAALIGCGAPQLQKRFLKGLSEEALLALPWLFDFWALPHQLPPAGDWTAWVILGGRGAGKTRAGAEWVRAEVEGAGPADPGRARRIALIGETLDQAREVMVFGDSGILACTPPDRRPVWNASRRSLTWPNGAVAQTYSARDPEALRGPQFDLAWADELAKWRHADAAWTMLQFALRLGEHPRVAVTTTPRDVPLLKEILAAPSTVVTSAPTVANRANLAPSFLREVEGRYGGTRLGRQELEGVLLDEAEGALWTAQMLDAARRRTPPRCERIVVGVDPAVSAAGDDCGIVVAGLTRGPTPADWRFHVIEDATTGGSPTVWAQAAAAAAHRHGADRVVAEVNQGGALVQAVLAQVDPALPVHAVHASRGKQLRAEPVAALYEQGRVSHLPGLAALEDQMCRMTRAGYTGQGSPDRVDALVWAMTDLMGALRQGAARPRVRTL